MAMMLNRRGEFVDIDMALRKAFEAYAEEIGKKVSELSRGERQQAWLTWVLAGKLEEEA